MFCLSGPATGSPGRRDPGGKSRIDTSPITGEPVPVHVKPGDPVTSGCRQYGGAAEDPGGKGAGRNPWSQESWILWRNAAASKPKIDRFITRFARFYTPVVVFLALATAVIPSLVTGGLGLLGLHGPLLSGHELSLAR